MSDQLARNARGMLAMSGAMAAFTASDTLIKLASASLPATQIMGVRGVFASLFVLALVVASGQLRRLGDIARRGIVVRAGMEAVVAFTFITAIAQVALGVLISILQVAPLLMTLIAVLFLGETVGWRRWAAIAAGFIGVLLIVRPDGEAFDQYALLAVFCACLVALRDLSTRRIESDAPLIVAALASTMSVMLAGFAGAAVQAWQPVAGPTILYLAGAGVAVGTGNWLIITAFRDTEVSAVAPFRYAVVPFALLAGFVVFGEVPDAVAIVGVVLVIGSGLYAAHREAVRRRAARAGALPAAGGGPTSGA